jgi:hypothetical protein
MSRNCVAKLVATGLVAEMSSVVTDTAVGAAGYTERLESLDQTQVQMMIVASARMLGH